MHSSTLARMRRLRWASYGLLAVAFILAYFHRMAPAVMASELQQAFSASGAALGILAGSYFLTYTAMQIPSGVFADTLGARKVVAAGLLLAGLGALVFATSATLTLAVAGRMLVGLGVSVTFIAMLKLASQWFYDREFATVAGLTILLGNLGALFGATPLSWAMGFTSWRSIFGALGLFSFVLALAVYAIVRNRPEDAGLPSMRELEGKSAHVVHQGHWRAALKEVLANRRTWPGFWASFGQGGMLFAFAGLWAFPFLRDVYGMDSATAANHISFILGGFAVSSLLMGVISDRLGRRRPVMLLNMLACLLCWLPLLFTLSMPLWLSYTLFALLGLCSTGYTLTLSTTKEVNRPALSGMATSVANMGTFCGAVVLQPLVGWAMDLAWDGRLVEGVRVYDADAYRIGLGLLVASLLLGLVAALTTRETYGRYLQLED